MNVLCLGSEVVGAELAVELVRAFLGARFDGGERYVERLRESRSDGEGDEGWPSHDCMSSPSAGVSVWIDSLSREMLETGELARLMKEDAVVGVTSNPTIFQKALSHGRLVRRAARRGAEDRGRPEGDLPPARDARTSGAPAT